MLNTIFSICMLSDLVALQHFKVPTEEVRRLYNMAGFLKVTSLINFYNEDLSNHNIW